VNRWKVEIVIKKERKERKRKRTIKKEIKIYWKEGRKMKKIKRNKRRKHINLYRPAASIMLKPTLSNSRRCFVAGGMVCCRKVEIRRTKPTRT
jgi:hypothetical protein